MYTSACNQYELANEALPGDPASISCYRIVQTKIKALQGQGIILETLIPGEYSYVATEDSTINSGDEIRKEPILMKDIKKGTVQHVPNNLDDSCCGGHDHSHSHSHNHDHNHE